MKSQNLVFLLIFFVVLISVGLTSARAHIGQTKPVINHQQNPGTFLIPHSLDATGEFRESTNLLISSEIGTDSSIELIQPCKCFLTIVCNTRFEEYLQSWISKAFIAKRYIVLGALII